jgi:membrane protein YqaA with SNARE-associated domain
MRHRVRHFKGIIWILFFLLTLGVLFFFVDIEKVIEAIGVTNSYLVLFFVAMIAGSSSFTSSSYYATIVSLAGTGLNPWVIALVAGTGLSVGDAIFYLIGTWGRENISGKIKTLAEKYAKWLSRKPRFVVQSIVYLYTGFTPLPGDFLMVALSFARFPYLSFIIPGLLGNITLVLFILFGVTWTQGL